jgi:hypothetical protein
MATRAANSGAARNCAGPIQQPVTLQSVAGTVPQTQPFYILPCSYIIKVNNQSYSTPQSAIATSADGAPPAEAASSSAGD